MPSQRTSMDRRRVLATLGTVGATLATGASTSAAAQGGNDRSERGRGNWKDDGDDTESAVLKTGTDRITATFDRQLEQELHHGAQLAIYHDGEFVVDTAGGLSDPEGGETTTETRHVLFSCTKPYAAACVHLLAQRGELDYDDRVVEHWPDYAEEGTRKAKTTIRHVLSHQAGVPAVEIDGQAHLWSDPDAIAEGMEAAEPVYEPGTEPNYHTLSFGWLVGEIVRKVSGRRIDRFARDEIFEPLGMDNTSIGLPEGEEVDVATLVGFEPYDQITSASSGVQSGTNQDTADSFNSDFVQQQAIIPAANGIGTASDMLRFYACLLNGGKLEGTRLFTPETIDEWTSLQAETADDMSRDVSGRFAMGFFLGGVVQSNLGVTAPPTAFGHAGLGSSVGWADPENDIAFAYVTNGIRERTEQDFRVGTMADTVRHELDSRSSHPGRGRAWGRWW
ncbi:beta-lactamase family protein [Haloterrigena sp. SYSU A558-1]|uniref:Beta-lactamase family protein n=2 Tax=Haloterrigena gelatinilytica TaxID=2741724 RepID=A0A8J8GP23_9EURY|nr:beta-lactamase family protein [Haloterrigena gelatinilytica]NUC72202.1 beta-lactamase family protein [Haloterrigena gelatinilytica]